MIQAEQLHARILEELDLSRDIPDEELTELIHRVLDEASGREYIPLGKKAELGRELFNAFRKFDLLQEFLEVQLFEPLPLFFQPILGCLQCCEAIHGSQLLFGVHECLLLQGILR